MPSYEVSRTLVKSPPELWAELQEGDRLAEALGDTRVEATEPERELRWEAQGVRGTAALEPSGWGTKVTLTAEVEEQERHAASLGFWGRLRGDEIEPRPAAPRADIEQRLEGLLDSLGAAHRKPFARG